MACQTVGSGKWGERQGRDTVISNVPQTFNTSDRLICVQACDVTCVCMYICVWLCLHLCVCISVHMSNVMCDCVNICACIWVNVKVPYRSLKSLKDMQKQTKQCCVLWLHRRGKPGPLVQLVERLIRSSVSSYTFWLSSPWVYSSSSVWIFSFSRRKMQRTVGYTLPGPFLHVRILPVRVWWWQGRWGYTFECRQMWCWCDTNVLSNTSGKCAGVLIIFSLLGSGGQVPNTGSYWGLFSLAFCACDKHMTGRNIERKELSSACGSPSPIGGSWSRSSRQGLEVETMEEHWFQTCSWANVPLPFLYSPDPAAQE